MKAADADAMRHRDDATGESLVLEMLGIEQERQQPRRHALEFAFLGQLDQPAAAR